VNKKIFNHLVKKINELLNLPKHEEIKKQINEKTIVLDLPWTPKRVENFIKTIQKDFNVDTVDLSGSLETVTNKLDSEWSKRFWNGLWQPRTEVYQYTGWGIVDVVNKMNPKKVLDIGCGFNQFKNRIQNLVGIDPFNNSADYMVDILDFVDTPESYDVIIIFGSINFGDYEDVEIRMKRAFSLLAPGGKIFMRVNPGIVDRAFENHGYNWVNHYPWDFATAKKLATENNIKLIAYKQDNGNRNYIEYEK
jgi:SAM-dependent methyltransferase